MLERNAADAKNSPSDLAMFGLSGRFRVLFFYLRIFIQKRERWIVAPSEGNENYGPPLDEPTPSTSAEGFQ